jgi:cytochrome c oxidase cbb3-type subunit 1
MTITIGALLALSFLISVLGLFMFIWAQTNGLMQAGPGAAQVIFAKGEVGLVEEPSISPTELAALQHIESKEAVEGTTPYKAWLCQQNSQQGSRKTALVALPRLHS